MALIICVQFINVGIILDVLLFGGRVLPFRSKHAVVLRPATANPHNQNKKQPMRSIPDWVWFYLWPVDQMAWDFLPVAKCSNVKSKQFNETLLPIALKAAVTTGEQRKSSTVFSTSKRKRIRLLQTYCGLARILGGGGQRRFVNCVANYYAWYVCRIGPIVEFKVHLISLR